MIGCFEAIRQALLYPDSIGYIVAPTYPMLRDSTQRTFFEILPRELIASFNKSANELILTNGATIIFRSADEPEKLRGANLSWFFIDEASVLPTGTTWKILVGRLRRKPERGWITTTPKGFNWVYDEFAKEPRDDYWFESFSTAENPYLSADYIDSLKASYGGSFLRQEFYGEFISFEGLVYADFNPMKHIISEYPPIEKIKRIECGIDWGFINPSVAIFAGFDNDDNMYVLSEIYESKLEIEQFIDKVKAMQDKLDWQYGKKTEAYYCDPSEPMFIEKFNRAGLRGLQAQNEMVVGINEVTRRLADPPNMFIHENCINLIDEVRQYRYAETKEGKTIKEQPIKVHDHALDALRYLTMGQDKPELAMFYS